MTPRRRHPKLDFRYLKSRVGIGAVLSFHGLDKGLVRRGGRLIGPCPLHCGDNPTAFRVDLDRGLWHCFTACGGGDTVELVRKILGCSYAGAAHHLLQLSTGQSLLTPPHADSSSRTVHAAPFKPYKWSIPLNPKASFLQEHKKVSTLTAMKFEAGVSRASLFLNGTVAVRLHDLHGNPLGYCGRRLDLHDIIKWGKWRFPRNYPKKETLFNAHRARSCIKKGLVVVECPWAAMRLTQAGVPNVVALLGTTFSSLQLEWLAQAPKILIMLDGDNAGRTGAHALAGALNHYTEVAIYELPDGKEPEDLSDHELAKIVRQYLFF